MKKLKYVVFMIFFNPFVHSAQLMDLRQDDGQLYFMAFMQKCTAGLYDHAVIEVDVYSQTSYDVTFFLSRIYGVYQLPKIIQHYPLKLISIKILFAMCLVPMQQDLHLQPLRSYAL